MVYKITQTKKKTKRNEKIAAYTAKTKINYKIVTFSVFAFVFSNYTAAAYIITYSTHISPPYKVCADGFEITSIGLSVRV